MESVESNGRGSLLGEKPCAGPGMFTRCCLVVLFVDRNLKRAQEALILRGKLDLSSGLEFPLGFVGCLWLLLLAFAVAPAVEADGRFQYQEDVIAGSFNLSDGFCDSIGFGKRIIDRVSQFLHQVFQWLIHK